MLQRATFVRKWWIVLRTCATTLRYSMKAIVGTALRKPHARRAFVDQLCRDWSGALLRLIDLRYRVVGQEHLALEPGRPYIVMTNHASHYDIPVSFMAIPGSMRMLAKKELYAIPLFGTAMRAAEFLEVDRRNQEQARKDLLKAREKMESGIMLWIAPEGTRSRTGELMPFKKGGFHLALQTGATIIPVGIRGILSVLPPDSTDINLHQDVEVHIGAPIDASVYGVDQRQELVARVEASLRELIGQTTPPPAGVAMRLAS